MILEDALILLVGGIVDTVLGIPDFSIEAKNDGPRPIGAYASIDFVSDHSVGWEERTLVDNTGDDDITETIEGYRELTVSLDFFRDGAMDNARKVRTAFLRQTTLDTLSASGTGFIQHSDVRDLSEVLESAWEKRAQFDVTLSAIGADVDIIKSILSVTITGGFQTSGKSIPVSIQVDL